MKTLIIGEGTIGSYLKKNMQGEVKSFGHHADFVGSIENGCSVYCAFKKFKPNLVIHTAAMNSVTQCQKNIKQAVQTNVLGSFNILDACKKYKAKPVFLSSVSANNPAGIYGGSKLLMELMGDAVYCRLGTVLSEKSIVHKWYEQIQNGEILRISDFACVRYLMTLDEAAKFIVGCSNKPNGVYSPRMCAYSIRDIIGVLEILTNKTATYAICGLGPGEKLKDCQETSHSLSLLDKIRTII